MQNLLIIFLFLLMPSCKQAGNLDNQSLEIQFSQPVKVEMIGYSGNIMEPFLSRDGSTLFFNNLNEAPENTNLHWALKINDSTFKYKGEIEALNTAALEAVPSLDNAGNLYFISTRNYATTFSTIYTCNFSDGAVTNVHLVSGISKLQPGSVNFDAEVSADGQSLYFDDGLFDQSGNLKSADIVVATKNGTAFKRAANSDEIFKNINTDALEYAACTSLNQLELYFTRVAVPLTATSSPEIFISTRQHINDPFSKPSKITAITGFAEAVTIAPDQKTLYYHKKENGLFVLYMIKRK